MIVSLKNWPVQFSQKRPIQPDFTTFLPSLTPVFERFRAFSFDLPLFYADFLTVLAELGHEKNPSKSLLPRKQTRNALGILWFRCDYELRWLRKCQRAVKRLERKMRTVREVPELIGLSKALLDWSERERILLRIPLPAASKVPEPKYRNGKLVSEMRGLVLDEQPKAVNEVKPANSVTSQQST